MDWLIWALAEGFFMGLAKFGHGLVGSVSPTFAHVLMANLIVGMVQATIGLAGAKYEKEPLMRGRRGYLGWAALFGVGVFGAGGCAFAAFQMSSRADMGANTFISGVLSIVPAILLSWLLLKKGRPGARQWIGVIIAMTGAYLMVQPSLRSSGVQTWMYWSLGTMAFSATTEAIAQKIAAWGSERGLPKMNKFFLFFWGGLVMATSSLIGLAINGEHPLALFATQKLVGYSLFVALCNFGWWSCRLVAFQRGAPMAGKKLASVGTYLTTAMAGGVRWFDDALPWGKLIGAAMFIPAIMVAYGGWRIPTWGTIAGNFQALVSLLRVAQKAPAPPPHPQKQRAA